MLLPVTHVFSTGKKNHTPGVTKRFQFWDTFRVCVYMLAFHYPCNKPSGKNMVKILIIMCNKNDLMLKPTVIYIFAAALFASINQPRREN